MSFSTRKGYQPSFSLSSARRPPTRLYTYLIPGSDGLTPQAYSAFEGAYHTSSGFSLSVLLSIRAGFNPSPSLRRIMLPPDLPRAYRTLSSGLTLGAWPLDHKGAVLPDLDAHLQYLRHLRPALRHPQLFRRMLPNIAVMTATVEIPPSKEDGAEMTS
ncbi:hypothetical protein GYMLUDRAFT_252551 [Collybiopsis luxurians FD-317 M1]|uniref:Uncharacterized protein n=1 Tax=Collybiopsis luxurians FD-317 M1 TaxID=944289 RepID=A0A0D0B9I5_9AGAR|nr:hypothetical protein GYMLUDRAFT_252551 [Collybiopsis luxurians FD-317 M1]